MTARHTRADLATASALLERQWRTLRRWLGEVVGGGAGPGSIVDAPSVLPGVSVVELIDLTGRALGLLATAEPAPPGATILTLSEFLSTSRTHAPAPVEPAPDDDGEDDADEAPRSPAARGPLGSLDVIAAAAFARLDALGPEDRAITAGFTSLMLSDLVLSRLVELVLHGDDLARSVARSGERPVDPEALQLAGEVLLGIVVTRGGWSLELVDPLLWVRLAAGRLPREADRLGEALRARFTSDSVPDLGRMLPLL